MSLSAGVRCGVQRLVEIVQPGLFFLYVEIFFFKFELIGCVDESQNDKCLKVSATLFWLHNLGGESNTLVVQL